MTFARATEPIPAGSMILVRGGCASLASADLANAEAIEAGQTDRHFEVRMFSVLGGRDLQAIANGPIMDPNRIYLPAGKCSEDEMRQREAWREEG